MPAHVRFDHPGAASTGVETLVIAGHKARLRQDDVRALLPASVAAAWDRMLDDLDPGDQGAATASWTAEGEPKKVVLCVVPYASTHHNSPSRPDALASLVRKGAGSADTIGVVVALDDASHALAASCAVARAFPLFDGKGRRGAEERTDAQVTVGLLGADDDGGRAARIADSVRFAARLADEPTSVLDTDAFVAEARRVADEVGATIEVIRGDELRDRGFGGLWGVGKAATVPPSLVILSRLVESSDRTLAIVGKGIVYDTGGLSIKGKDHMPGMKIDMGGAAAALGGFRVAAQGASNDTVHALLCLAENSVGPAATRPDDILQMYSGKTVEVNNTDAEGRLVLADGVAYATRHLAPDIVVDLATLTGAQLVATGKRHAGIVCNDADLQDQAFAAGRRSGDLVWPLPWCPELFRKEFRSEVADMKNSVKDRMNGQCSCAAQFVAEHLDPDWEGAWLHVDMAGPVEAEDRGTGYGVALLAELLDF